jgi:WD40 repeat protein
MNLASAPAVIHTFERTLVLKAKNYSPDVAIFSPDDKYIITCSDKPAITIWDVQAGTVYFGPVELTPEHVAPHDVDFVALSSNGKRMCSGPRNQYGEGGGDNVINLWVIVTDREIPAPTPLDGLNDRFTHAALSNDGMKLVTASYDHIRVWDLRDLRTAQSIVGTGAHAGSIYPVAFFADGRNIVSAGQYDKQVNIWDSDTVDVTSGPHTAHSDNGEVKSLALSPDGRKMVMGFESGKVILMDTKHGKISDPAKQFLGQTECVTSVTFSPDGSWIASGSLDAKIRVWDTGTGHSTCEPLVGHKSGIRSISISRDGKKIVSNSGESVLIWTLQ